MPHARNVSNSSHVVITPVAKTQSGRGTQGNTLDAIVAIATDRLESQGFARIRLRRVLLKSSLVISTLIFRGFRKLFN